MDEVLIGIYLTLIKIEEEGDNRLEVIEKLTKNMEAISNASL